MKTWHIERSTHSEGGYEVWLLTDGGHQNSTIWASFNSRVAALACIRGYKVIGFVPDPRELK